MTVAIESILEKRLQSLPGGTPVAWEDVPYKPTTGTVYLAVRHLANEPIDHAVTLDVLERRGIFQVTIFHPAGQGKVAAKSKAEAVAEHFANGLRLIDGGVTVEINRTPFVGSGYSDTDWYKVPVTIYWQSFKTP